MAKTGGGVTWSLRRGKIRATNPQRSHRVKTNVPVPSTIMNQRWLKKNFNQKKEENVLCVYNNISYVFSSIINDSLIDMGANTKECFSVCNEIIQWLFLYNSWCSKIFFIRLRGVHEIQKLEVGKKEK